MAMDGLRSLWEMLLTFVLISLGFIFGCLLRSWIRRRP
jgi:hypothetical protein